jgi:PEP-CTERM motif
MFTQLTWTNPTFENYYAFTVGVAGGVVPAIPEPATLLIAGLGLGVTGVLRRRMN